MSHWWVIDRKEGTPDVFLPQEQLIQQLNRNGINPGTVRKTLLDAFNGDPVLFHLVTGDGAIAVDHLLQPTDLLFWSWVPIFSDRARELILGIGGDPADFIPCVFATRPDQVFFLHLPEVSFDIVDVAASQFTMMVPMQPPIPFGIKVLSMRNVQVALPPCLRMAVPGHSQVFSDLLVSHSFHTAWVAAALTGAVFRQVA